MWFCCHLLTVSGLVFQPNGWNTSLIEFHRSMFLICTFAYIVHQLVLSCYAHVPRLFFIIVSQFQLQFSLMFFTSVGAFSTFCHADTISHARWCSLLSYVHYWKRERDIFLLPVCSTYWPGKYTTHVDPHVDNSRKVWSWYDHPLPSYSVFVSWYVTWPCDLVTLTFWPWSVVIHGGSLDQPCHQVWILEFLSYEL